MISSTHELDYATRFPDIFHPSLLKRFRIAIYVGASIIYLAYSFWFFSIVNVMGRADWSIAGAYLADWVSYEVRPDIAVDNDGLMRITYPRYTPIGNNPNPDWLLKSSTFRLATISQAPLPIPPATGTNTKKPTVFMVPNATTGNGVDAGKITNSNPVYEEVVTKAVVEFSSMTRVSIENRTITVTDGNETLVARMEPGKGVIAVGPLPSFATQRGSGAKIVLSLGLPGWGEIDESKVRIRKRFIGWANFLFDTDSPYHGMSWAAVMSTTFSNQRLDPKQSNLSLAISNILYNGEWQHLDVWSKLLQTIVMAFVGTLFATIVAFPLSFIAARNVTKNRFLNQVTKRFFDFLRSVDMLIWALFFTRGFGPGPLAGISAIFFTDTGSLGKLYSEALENIDDKQREGVSSVGAHPAAVQRFGVIPQVLPVFASQALYYWESNTRSATIIGAVGAGGIGLKLWEAMRTNSDWENVAYMVLLILIIVYIFDALSARLRRMLIGAPQY